MTCDASLRPQRLSEFIGQEQARANLSVFIEAARARRARRSTMCCSSARPVSARPRWRRSSRANWASTSAPPPARSSPRRAISRRCSPISKPRDVLFIDEIHRLNPAVEEILYPAMEDFQLDLIIGEGPAARSVKIDLVAIYARRRDHARGPADKPAARPLRHSGAA